MEESKSTIKEKMKLLQYNVELQINNFHTRRNINKRRATCLHLSITLLGAFSTIILGLKFATENLFAQHAENIALMISALITIISGFNTFFDHKDLWINFTKTRNQLYNLKFDLDYYLAGNNQPKIEDLNKFKDTYQKIMKSANNEWLDSIKD